MTSGVAELHGANPGAVLAAIKARAARFRAGARGADGRKLGLVIEGGAMRGVCSAGGAVALEHLGYRDLFDEVYGTSAGAMNGSYFLAGQGALGIRIYYEDMIRRQFMNVWRPWKVLDVDRLFEQVVTRDKALRLDAILSSRSKLFIAVLDANSGARALIDAQASGTHLLSALKAATALPLLYNRAITVDGRPYLDAGLVNSFPIEDALAAGCTDILVLLTRPPGFRRAKPGPAACRLFDLICARGNRRLSEVYAHHHERDNEVRDLAFGRVRSSHHVNIATICTDDGEPVQRMTTDPQLLHAGAVRFGRKTLRFFDSDPDSWVLPAPV